MQAAAFLLAQQLYQSLIHCMAEDKGVGQSAIAIVLRQALAEASALGGEDQQIEQITFEVGDGLQAWGGPLGVSFEMQVVTRLR